MNYTRFLVSFSLAGMMFAGIFYGLQNRFELEQSLTSPFSETMALSDVGFVSISEEKIIKTKEGELVGLYPGALLGQDFEGRVLLDGEAFFSGVLLNKRSVDTFINQGRSQVFAGNGGGDFDPRLFGLSLEDFSEEDISLLFGGTPPDVDVSNDVPDETVSENVSLGKTKALFSLKDYTPKAGEMIVGKALVRYPLSSVFVIRDNEKKKSTVYAYGAGIEILFEGGTHGFVVPSLHKVTLYDDLINERTGQLFYTKLQKDFRLQSFDIFGTASKDTEATPEGRLVKMWQIQEAWRNDMKIYAQKSYVTLIGAPTSFGVGSLLDSMSAFQKKIAIGYPQRKKDVVYFESTLRPFVETFGDALLRKENSNLLANLGSVKATIFSPRWETLLRENKSLETKWTPFAHAQQVSTRTASLQEPESSFYSFWDKTEAVDSLGDLQQLLFDSQVLLTLEKKVQAREFLLRMKVGVENISFSSDQREEVTTFRRILLQMLRQSSFLQSEEVFLFYKELVQDEMLLYPKGEELTNEIRLEVARDALYFLRKYLDQGSNIEVSEILLEIYKSMQVDEIKGQLQRNIFSQEETEMIAFIDLLGGARLSTDEIERIKELQKIEDEIDRFNEDLFEEPEEPLVPEKTPNGYIKDEQGLRDFFEDLDLNIYKLRTPLNVEKKQISFRGLGYKDHTLSGVFDIPRQSFETLDAGILKKEGIRKRFFEGVLREIDINEEQQAQELIPEELQKEPEASIPQNDRITLLRKKYLVDLLRKYQVTVKISSIQSLNTERTMFAIRDAEFPNVPQMIDLVYDTDTKSFSKVTFEKGGDGVEIEKVFALDGFVAAISDEIYLLLNPVIEEE